MQIYYKYGVRVGVVFYNYGVKLYKCPDFTMN